eukprot:CAMPEP_0197315204 /NCGR_PEP_ID=MMETSP0891-20130614/37193_1 /TAXON_ID=44058 ORGANISM="Aureoumbra lagunensis, Strain CCMP1510" /NCGR_SAMPLE_ID=MMETSP0891 /ASSEMBLY_ACC=CAM_ASM_000534 /LENGTH=227 /DNA_ID=CAMNT_0042804045 /DNA_START=28 /DNA_END=714 /DNA_ORIENTATION=+
MATLVPWRQRIERSIAISRSIRGGNYVQLGTVDNTGKPHVRTIVFRGFANEYDMKFITDARSEKCNHSSACEVCWWFSKSSEQFRISGNLKYIGSNETDPFLLSLRKQQWGNLSDKAREQFFWAETPKSPVIESSSSSSSSIPPGGRDENGKLLQPPDIFLLVLLQPSSCDYLRLTDNFRQYDSLLPSPASTTATSSNENDNDLKESPSTCNTVEVVDNWLCSRVNP